MAFPENASDGLARCGHDIHHQQVSGNARVHNGDNNYRFDYEDVNATHEGVQKLLPRADGAQINSSLKEHEPSCLPGTRIEVLQEIKTWAEDGSDKRCVFWLSGMAGTGKSTIARTVAREHLAQNQLSASLFFSRGGGDVANARKLFTTIAFQLIQRSPALKPGILKAVTENLDIAKRALTEQWRLLILQLLAIAREESPQQPLLIVINALDECEGERDVRLILQLLASANTHIPPIQLRVLITSRPDTPIRLGFGENPGICLYWVEHLQKSDSVPHDGDEVHQFLRKHFLHWLEALAWLGRSSEAVLALISLDGQIKASNTPSLHEWVRDAKRFAVYNRGIIEEAPLQLYSSALIFTPENSIVRRTFDHSIPQWIQTKPKVQANWSASLQTLEGHSGPVSSVAFSPDGRSVVSGSYDETVRLWDAATGAPLQTLEGHSDSVTSVALSPDGKVKDALLLSGNWVREGEENLIWLHPDHRGRLMGSLMGIVVLAQSSGRILTMRLKEGLKAI